MGDRKLDRLITYLAGRDHDADLLDGLGELFSLHGAVVVQVEVLEALHEDGLIAHAAAGLLGELLEQLLFKTKTKVTNQLLVRPPKLLKTLLPAQKT